jgi:large subunit ribosomal protein L30
MKKGKKYLTVKLVKSPHGLKPGQEATLRGLGLTRINMVSKLEDTSCVRGMINKVIHMIEVQL